MKPKLGVLNRVGVDFDLTICNSYYDGKKDKWVMGEPIEGARDGLQAIKKLGKKPWIYTSRPGYEEIEIREWLEKYDMMQFIHGVKTSKELFFVIIDDRALNFDGNWTNTIKKLKKHIKGGE